MQKLFTDYLIEVNYKFNAQKLLDESNRMSWKPFHYEHSLDIFKNHPKIKGHTWGINERIICTLIWPISVLLFIIAFLKTYFK